MSQDNTNNNDEVKEINNDHNEETVEQATGEFQQQVEDGQHTTEVSLFENNVHPKVEVTENIQPNNEVLQQENIAQPTGGFEHQTANIQQNNVYQNGEFQQFANNGQPNFQPTGNQGFEQQNINQQQFVNQNPNGGNAPKQKKKFYKNPVYWVIAFTVILLVIFVVQLLGANTDMDNDGLTRAEEIETYGTNPRESDTDSDGFTDSVEVDLGTNPTVKAVSMSPGTWTVGEDIAAGTYNMMCLSDEKGNVVVKNSAGEQKEIYELGSGLLRDGNTVSVELEDGDVIEVEDGLSVIYFESVEE